MEDSKFISAIALIQKRKKTLIIITLICVICTMLYVIFFHDSYSSSCTLTLSKSENLLNNFVTSSSAAYSSSTPEFAADMLDNEAITYVESLKKEKSANARINPYKDNILFYQEDFIYYVVDQQFKEYLSSKGIDPNKVSVECVVDSLSVRTHSSEKGESFKLLQQMQKIIPEYIEFRSKEVITEFKDYHSAWMEQDKAKIQELVKEYEQLKTTQTANTLSPLEKQREVLNEYASVIANYEVSSSVVQISDDYLAMNLSPKTYIYGVKQAADSKVILYIVYFIVSAIFGVALSAVIIFISEFFKEYKKKTAERA